MKRAWLAFGFTLLLGALSLAHFEPTAAQVTSIPAPSGTGGANPCTSTNGAFQYDNSGVLGCGGVAQNSDGTASASKLFGFASPTAPTFNGGGTTTVNWPVSNFSVVTASGGNTTLAFTAPLTPTLLLLELINDATVRTFTPPAAFTSNTFCAPPFVSTASFQLIWWDGTNYNGLGCNSNAPPSILALTERTIIGLTAAAGQELCGPDNTNHIWACAGAAPNNAILPATGATANQFSTYIDNAGTQHTSAVTTTNLTAGTASPLAATAGPYAGDLVCNITTTITGMLCTSNVGTTATAFVAPVFTFAGAGTGATLDGVTGHKGLSFATQFDFVGATSGTVTASLIACSTWTATTPCASKIVLWASSSAAITTVLGASMICEITASGTATSLITTCSNRLFSGSVVAKVASVPNTSANWAIGWQITYGNAGATANGAQQWNNTDFRWLP